MKQHFTALSFAIILLGLVAGCYSTPDGRYRMGPPGMKDKLIQRYERPVDQVYAASKEVLKFNGTPSAENTITHTLEGKIDTRRVWIKVEEVEPKITQVTVQARKKNMAPDVDLASQIMTQIALHLR